MSGKRWGSGRYSRLFATTLLAATATTISCTAKGNGYKGIAVTGNDSYEASLYRQNCAICHGKEALGKEIDGKLVPSLRFGDAAKRTDEEIYQQIANGKLPMPSFKGQLTESEIRRMVVFIRKDLQGREAGD